MIEHDLKVEHPDKPLAVQPVYRWRSDGTFRRAGKRVSTEIGTGTDVLVRVWVTDHPRPLKAHKAYLLAVSAHGWPRYWRCPDCDERVYDVPLFLNGHRYDTSPGNLKWVEDTGGREWHRLTCMEKMMNRPYESGPGCPNEQPRQRDAANFIDDYADTGDEGSRGGRLPQMFHSVTSDQDKVLSDPDKDPYYLD